MGIPGKEERIRNTVELMMTLQVPQINFRHKCQTQKIQKTLSRKYSPKLHLGIPYSNLENQR
jgi:hypothetical protein